MQPVVPDRAHLTVSEQPKKMDVVPVLSAVCSVAALATVVVCFVHMSARMDRYDDRSTSTAGNEKNTNCTQVAENAARASEIAASLAAQALTGLAALDAITQKYMNAANATMAKLTEAYNATAAAVNEIPRVGVRVWTGPIQVSGDDYTTTINYHVVPRGGSYTFDVGLTGNEKLLACWMDWEEGWFGQLGYLGNLKVNCDAPNNGFITVSAANAGGSFLLKIKIFGLIVAQ